MSDYTCIICKRPTNQQHYDRPQRTYFCVSCEQRVIDHCILMFSALSEGGKKRYVATLALGNDETPYFDPDIKLAAKLVPEERKQNGD